LTAWLLHCGALRTSETISQTRAGGASISIASSSASTRSCSLDIWGLPAAGVVPAPDARAPLGRPGGFVWRGSGPDPLCIRHGRVLEKRLALGYPAFPT